MINSDTAIPVESLKSVSMNNISGKVKSICIYGDQNREVMEQLSACIYIDDVVMVVAQHCPKLKTLQFESNNITC